MSKFRAEQPEHCGQRGTEVPPPQGARNRADSISAGSFLIDSKSSTQPNHLVDTK